MITNRSDIDLIKQAHQELEPQREHCNFFEYFTKVVERASELQKQRSEIEQQYEREIKELSI